MCRRVDKKYTSLKMSDNDELAEFAAKLYNARFVNTNFLCAVNTIIQMILKDAGATNILFEILKTDVQYLDNLDKLLNKILTTINKSKSGVTLDLNSIFEEIRNMYFDGRDMMIADELMDNIIRHSRLNSLYKTEDYPDTYRYRCTHFDHGSTCVIIGQNNKELGKSEDKETYEEIEKYIKRIKDMREERIVRECNFNYYMLEEYIGRKPTKEDMMRYMPLLAMNFNEEYELEQVPYDDRRFNIIRCVCAESEHDKYNFVNLYRESSQNYRIMYMPYGLFSDGKNEDNIDMRNNFLRSRYSYDTNLDKKTKLVQICANILGAHWYMYNLQIESETEIWYMYDGKDVIKIGGIDELINSLKTRKAMPMILLFNNVYELSKKNNDTVINEGESGEINNEKTDEILGDNFNVRMLKFLTFYETQDREYNGVKSYAAMFHDFEAKFGVHLEGKNRTHELIGIWNGLMDVTGDDNVATFYNTLGPKYKNVLEKYMKDQRNPNEGYVIEEAKSPATISPIQIAPSTITLRSEEGYGYENESIIRKNQRVNTTIRNVNNQLVGAQQVQVIYPYSTDKRATIEKMKREYSETQTVVYSRPNETLVPLVTNNNNNNSLPKFKISFQKEQLNAGSSNPKLERRRMLSPMMKRDQLNSLGTIDEPVIKYVNTGVSSMNVSSANVSSANMSSANMFSLGNFDESMMREESEWSADKNRVHASKFSDGKDETWFSEVGKVSELGGDMGEAPVRKQPMYGRGFVPDNPKETSEKNASGNRVPEFTTPLGVNEDYDSDLGGDM